MEKIKNKYTLKEKIKAIGLGAVTAASFIGPGTVTSATRGGASFGYAILWSILFSIVATIVLQEMSARLGIITQKGLGEHIATAFDNPVLNKIAIWLVGISITIGCTAYISGDILGGTMGIATLTGLPQNILGPIVGVCVLLLILSGSSKLLEKLLVVLVAIMSVTFITTMAVAKPDLGEVFKGMFIPTIPDESIISIIALIGTTVVPYNFFIHAASVKERWNKPEELTLCRWDTVFCIGIGGLITASILITSGTLMKGMDVQNVADLLIQLEPLLGSWSKVFICVGLFSAGLSSAIASPLGAAYTLSGLLGWKPDVSDKRFKNVCIVIVIIGIIVSATGFNPMMVLVAAQALNGLILTIVAIFLLKVTNDASKLGEYANGPVMKIVGTLIVLVTVFLGGYSIVTALAPFLG